MASSTLTFLWAVVLLVTCTFFFAVVGVVAISPEVQARISPHSREEDQCAFGI